MSLSPGCRWQDKLKLKSLDDVLGWRAWWLKRCGQNRRVREGLLEACRHDLLLYVNLFVWQFNPRALGREVGPFTTWAFQDEDFLAMVGCIEDQVNLVSEKSRDMGFSWMYLLVMDWLSRFHPYKKFLCISRSEAAVEDDDPDSLFWKIDFVHQNLPEWLHQPERFLRRKMFFGYPNGSSITGQASTGRAGVGGRATAILVDEFAQIKEDWEVLHRTSDTSYCRMFNSTHKGVGTAFYQLCTDELAFPPARWRRLVRHWIDHPRKSPGRYRFDQQTQQIVVLDRSYSFPERFAFRKTPAPVGGPYPGIRSPWYDAACDDKGNNSRAIAEDLDINPKGAVSQVFDALRICELKRTQALEPYWRGDVELDPATGLVRQLVRDPHGPLKLWLQLRPGGKAKESKYVFGCDVSTGSGATNSCASIGDAKLGEKVGSYTTPFRSPDKLAPLVVALCKWLQDEDGNPARLAWEMPGPGLLFSETVMKLGYRNIYCYLSEETTGPKLFLRENQSKPGWWASGPAKLLLVQRYRAALENGKYVTHEAEELDECLDFRWTKDSKSLEHAAETSNEDPSGARGNHGDRVIASALMWMLMAGQGEAGAGALVKEPDEPLPGSFAWRRQLGKKDDEIEEEDWQFER